MGNYSSPSTFALYVHQCPIHKRKVQSVTFFVTYIRPLLNDEFLHSAEKCLTRTNGTVNDTLGLLLLVQDSLTLLFPGTWLYSLLALQEQYEISSGEGWGLLCPEFPTFSPRASSFLSILGHFAGLCPWLRCQGQKFNTRLLAGCSQRCAMRSNSGFIKE